MSTILVVDDEKSIRITVGEFLRREEHTVVIAETAEEAFQELDAHPIEIVVSDIVLPGMSGVDLLKHVKTTRPQIEFILMTGEPTFETATEAVRSGAFDYLSKPVRKNDLLRVVGNAVAVTSLRQQRQTLAEENERYREELERLVDERTGALRQSEKRYRAVVEDQTELICRLDRNLKIHFANTAFESFFPHTDSPHLSTAFSDLFPPNERDELQVHLDRLSPDAPVVTFPSQLKNRQDISRWIDWQAHAIVGEDGRVAEIQAIGRDLTEQKQTEAKLADHRERLSSLSLQLTVAEERERNRIAADLHDWVGHSLALARVQLSRVQKTISEPTASESLQDLSLLLRRTAKDVRDLIFDLSPPFLDELGFPGAIAEWLDGAVAKKTLLEVSYSYDETPLSIDKETATLLYRSVRELVTNTIKHADATRVDVTISVDQGALISRVRDNGNGFNPATDGLQNRNSGVFGLFSIHERMQSLGGHLEIESTPGTGTTITLYIPTDPITTKRSDEDPAS